jgi:hypothetical protein
MSMNIGIENNGDSIPPSKCQLGSYLYFTINDQRLSAATISMKKPIEWLDDSNQCRMIQFPPLTTVQHIDAGQVVMPFQPIQVGSPIAYYSGTAHHVRDAKLVDLQHIIDGPDKLGCRSILNGHKYKQSIPIIIVGSSSMDKLIEEGCGLGQLVQTSSKRKNAKLVVEIVYDNQRLNMDHAKVNKWLLSYEGRVEVAGSGPLQKNVLYILAYFVATKEINPGEFILSTHKFHQEQSTFDEAFFENTYYFVQLHSQLKQAMYHKTLAIECTSDDLTIVNNSDIHVFGKWIQSREVISTSYENWCEYAEVSTEFQGKPCSKKRARSKSPETVEPEKHYHEQIDISADIVLSGHPIFGQGDGQIHSTVDADDMCYKFSQRAGNSRDTSEGSSVYDDPAESDNEAEVVESGTDDETDVKLYSRE